MNERAASPHHIRRVAVVGAGYMGGGIAQVIAAGGVSVALVDRNPEDTVRARDRILNSVRDQQRRGLLDERALGDIEANLHAAPSLEEGVSDADYITEAVAEDMTIKRQAFADICGAARTDAIIASNTSALAISELATATSHPERFLGVHWMNPAPFIPGVELIAAPQTSPEVMSQVRAFITQLGKVAAVVADTPGFVANRLQFALFREAARMLEEGVASATEIDSVVANTFGFRLALFGPLTIADMAGLDVYHASYASLEAALGERFSVPPILTDRVAHGDLGLKSGDGIYAFNPEGAQRLIEYRERGYALLAKFKDELGPAPLPTERTNPT